MQAVWVSIQWNHPLDFIRPFLAMTIPEQAHHCSSGLTKPFAYERLFLWRHMHRGYDLLYPRQLLRFALRWHLCAQRVKEGGTRRHWVWTELHSCWEMEREGIPSWDSKAEADGQWAWPVGRRIHLPLHPYKMTTSLPRKRLSNSITSVEGRNASSMKWITD